MIFAAAACALDALTSLWELWKSNDESLMLYVVKGPILRLELATTAKDLVSANMFLDVESTNTTILNNHHDWL